jgi:hypothetical protein
MRFESLDADQQAAFRRRLARLGVDENALIADELIVPPGTTMQLSPSPEAGGEPRRLVTGDLDILRKWVGTPDALKDNRRVSDLHRRLTRFPTLAAATAATGRLARTATRAGTASVTLADLIDVRPPELESAVTRHRAAVDVGRPDVRLSVLELETLRAVADTYVHGNKASVAQFKSAVEKFFGLFEVWGWFYTEIRVTKNSTLTFGPGANVATAHQVVLEPGARIRSFGHLRLDCSILKREKFSVALPSHVLATDITVVPHRLRIP